MKDNNNILDIQLIKAPSDYTGMLEDGWYQPLNLIWLSSYMLSKEISSEILDGQMLTLNEILEKIKSNIIAISLDVLSVNSFDIIAKTAKSYGALVIAGGQYATQVPFQILSTNKNVDFVIRYDGEYALSKIVEYIKSKKVIPYNLIPNLCWRDGNNIHSNSIEYCNLNLLPIPDRKSGGLNIENYFTKFQNDNKKLKSFFKFTRPANTYSAKGCPRRNYKQGCSFCSRIDRKIRRKSPEKVYNEYKILVDEYKVDYISDFSDNWINLKWILSLTEQFRKYGELNVPLRIYGDIRDINKQIVLLLKELNIDTILLGIESGDNSILKMNGKKRDSNETLKIISLLSENEIKISDAYILGLIGENNSSLMKTFNLTKTISKICRTEITYCNILTPLPGSIAWNLLLERNNYLKDKYLNDYHLDLVELQKTFILNFCKKLDYEFLLGVRNEVLNNAILPSREFIN